MTRTYRIGSLFFAFTVLLQPTQVSATTVLDIDAGDEVWNLAASPGASPVNTVTIARTSGDPQEELQIGWQISLSIVADPGAVGELTFGGATLPTTDYPLDGVSGGLILNITGTDLFAADDDQTFNGVPISTTPQNLLDTTFSALPGTRGVFRIFAQPGLSETSWADNNFEDQEFANVPFVGSAVEIGSVNVVPEPASSAAAGLVILAVGGMSVRRRRLAPVARRSSIG